MKTRRLPLLLLLFVIPAPLHANETPPPEITVDRQAEIPKWARQQRRLLSMHARLAKRIQEAYFTEEGTVRINMEHGGGTQAPDDVLESLYKFPMYYALGAKRTTWDVFWRAWNGTTRQGMKHDLYVNEMPKYLDWHHNGEHFQGFWLGALCAPHNDRYRRLALKYASLYDGSDRPNQNYDPDRKLIPSILHGGAGPKLDQSVRDWIGGNITEKKRNFWQAWLDSDHGGPINLVTTNFGTVAFMLTGDEHWRTTTMDYIDAWRRRAEDNGGIIPSIVHRDGTVPDDWWGGVMGWNFKRFGGLFMVSSGPRAAWGNAALLTGDTSYYDTLRHLSDILWKHRYRVEEDLGWGVEKGDWDVPRYYSGEKQWHGGLERAAGVYANILANLWWTSMTDADLRRVLERRDVQGAAGHATWQEGGYEPKWIRYLTGRNDGWPRRALSRLIDRTKSDLEAVRKAIENENTQPDVWPVHRGWMGPLVNLMTGGPVPLWHGQLHRARFRYFDPERTRPGLPEHCAALVKNLTDTTATLTLVNTSPDESHRVLVQNGAYAQHRCRFVRPEGGEKTPVDGPVFAVTLKPATKQTLTVHVDRYTRTPTLAFPWNRKK